MALKIPTAERNERINKLQHIGIFSSENRVLENPFWIDSDGFKLACYYEIVDAGYKTVVIFHGNGETASDYII